jgi:YidC/Oxa1 family membrane protein insertase
MWDTYILSPMITALLLIYQLLWHNFGLAIIVFTILIRLITLPLTMQQTRSQQKMAEMQSSKKWQDLLKKYKDDKQKLQEEQLKLYREIGFNPLSGCLPLLIQFPIIIGLYQSITRTMAATPISLLDLSKHFLTPSLAPLIPIHTSFLWIADLAAPERLYLPFLPNIGIPVLTILVFITTWLSTKLTTPPSADPQSASMGKMMSWYMPILIAWLSYSFAAGLAVYFVVSNALQIVQSAAMGRVNWRNVFSFGASPAPAKK